MYRTYFINLVQGWCSKQALAPIICLKNHGALNKRWRQTFIKKNREVKTAIGYVFLHVACRENLVLLAIARILVPLQGPVLEQGVVQDSVLGRWPEPSSLDGQ